MFLSTYSWTRLHNNGFPMKVAHFSAALNWLFCIIVRRKDWPDCRIEKCSSRVTAVIYDWHSINSNMYRSMNAFAVSILQSSFSFSGHITLSMFVNWTSKVSSTLTTTPSSWLIEPLTISRNNWAARSFASAKSSDVIATFKKRRRADIIKWLNPSEYNPNIGKR